MMTAKASSDADSAEERPQRGAGGQRDVPSVSLIGEMKEFWDSVRIYVFVVGGALVVIAAARNSITWHLQSFWGASGDYWQRQWEWLNARFGFSEHALAVYGTFWLSFLVFWLGNVPLLIMDITGRPHWLTKYRVQKGKNEPVPPRKVVWAVLTVLFNQTVVGIPFSLVLYRLMKSRGCSFGSELPTFQWVLCELMIYSFVEEIMFYYGHRLFHVGCLYRAVHKKHHEWTAPIGITALYAHPVEHMLCNMLPPAMGPLLMGSHLATAWLWFAIALLSTTVSHCGYHLPLLPSPEAHDFHHAKFVNNFGVLGVLDRLHGTDSLFRATKAYERHNVLVGFTPLSQQIPDDTKNGKHVEASGK